MVHPADVEPSAKRSLMSKLNLYHLNIVLLSALVILILYGVFSSLPGDRVNESDAGMVLTLEETATSWNDRKRSRIETDQGIFNVSGVVSAMKGVKTTVVTYESGQRRLCLSDREKCLRVIDRR